MSPERSKFLWITVAASAFVLVVAIAGVFLFYPKNRAPAAPATVGNTAAPKPPDPQDYLNAPATAPTETKRNGDVIVIYGDKPQSLPPLGGTPGSVGGPNQGAQGVSGDQGVLGDQGATPMPSAQSGAASQTDGATSGNPPPARAAPSGSAPDMTQAEQASPAPKTLAPSTKARVASPARPSAKPKVATTTTKKAIAQPSAPQYWIQTASFTERGKADNLREGLSSKGISALIAVKDINGKSWYRVRVGPYSSAKEASGWLSKVKLVKGCDEAYVTSETMKK